MHSHDRDGKAAESLRPKAARIDETDRTLVARAAAEGRWSAVGPDGLAHLQRVVGNEGVAAAMGDEERSPVHEVVASAGRPLPTDVRADMETRMGHDFGDVRIHDDGRAHDSAVAVNAHAYTVGSNIVFQRDRYDPSSTEGRTTLAHELTHFIQQRSGPVEGTPATGGIRVSDPADRFEREAAANAERVMAAPTAPSAVQREAAEEEEEPLQGSFDDAAVQREAAEEEEEPMA